MGLACVALLVTLGGCHIYNSYPAIQTDGSGSSVTSPNTSTKAVVWGTRPEAVQSLTTWLLKRGFTLVDGVKLNQLASDPLWRLLERRHPQIGKNRRSEASHFHRCGRVPLNGNRN